MRSTRELPSSGKGRVRKAASKVVIQHRSAIERQVSVGEGLARARGQLRCEIGQVALLRSADFHMIDEPLGAFVNLEGSGDLSGFALILAVHHGSNLHVPKSVVVIESAESLLILA